MTHLWLWGNTISTHFCVCFEPGLRVSFILHSISTYASANSSCSHHSLFNIITTSILLYFWHLYMYYERSVEVRGEQDQETTKSWNSNSNLGKCTFSDKILNQILKDDLKNVPGLLCLFIGLHKCVS